MENTVIDLNKTYSFFVHESLRRVEINTSMSKIFGMLDGSFGSSIRLPKSVHKNFLEDVILLRFTHKILTDIIGQTNYVFFDHFFFNSESLVFIFSMKSFNISELDARREVRRCLGKIVHILEIYLPKYLAGASHIKINTFGYY